MIMVAIGLIAGHYEYWTLSTFLLLGALACLPMRSYESRPLSSRDSLWMAIGIGIVLAVGQLPYNWEPPRAIGHFIEHPAFLTAVWFIYLTAVLRRRQKLLRDEPPADH